MPTRNQTAVYFAVGAFSAGAGIAAGYFLAKKKLESSFTARLEVEIADAKAYYQEMYSTPVFDAPAPVETATPLPLLVNNERFNLDADTVGKALDAVREYSPSEDPVEDRRAPVVVNNIFTNHTPPGEEVLGALMASRDPSEPYIITKEEFYENEPDYEQVQFTYYEGDQVLVDDRNEFDPLDNERVAGEDNLLRFGYGSGDENVLYVRNETLDPPLDLHITRSVGRYAVEVLAIEEADQHLAHSHRRFRLQDE